MVPAGSRGDLCGLQGLVPPRSRGAAARLLLSFPAGSGGSDHHILLSFLTPSSLAAPRSFLSFSSMSAKVFGLASAFVCRQGASNCCPVCIPTQTSAPGSVFFDPHLWGKTLSHVELSVLNTLWLENGNTFTAQREGR